MLLEKNLLDVKEKIRNVCSGAGRSPDDITIVAVSKTVSFSRMIDLSRLDILDFGESRVKELREKYYNISFQHPGRLKWHMIGHLQTNKVNELIAFINLIHSLDSFKLAEDINESAKKINRVIDVLVQVNTSKELQKHGVAEEEAEELCEKVCGLENVRVKGLMTIAELTEDREVIRQNFRSLKNLYDKLKPAQKDFEFLSMGMSNDYDIAIEEGSNILRLGTALFGERERR